MVMRRTGRGLTGDEKDVKQRGLDSCVVDPNPGI
jgi:hypothetical protein